MIATEPQTDIAEYLAEIREHVCSRCIERPPEGPPCGPLGKVCGVEQHLPELIEAIRTVHSPMFAPYLEHNRQEICEKCAFLHSSICPCPMDYLSALVVEAVEAVDKRHEDRERERDFLANRSEQAAPGIQAIRQAFEEARDEWTGCDWHTHFGNGGVDLCDVTTAEAERMAAQSAGTPAGADWHTAVGWLARVKHHADRAQAEAAVALAAAEAEDWPGAMRHAQRAMVIEFETGRPLRSPHPPNWKRFYEAVKGAATRK
jgi:hypothetical protein